MAPTRPQRRSRSASTKPSTEPTRSRSYSHSQPTRYAHLAPHTTHISRTKILKTWKPLPLATQDRIRQALLDVREASKARRRRALPRPKNGKAAKNGAATLGGVMGDEDWEGAVDDIVEKLTARLPRMPFPPQHSHSSAKTSSTTSHSATRANASASELEFSLERILARTSTLRATLSSNNQSVKLLKAQIKREEKALKRDESELKGLEEGVRSARELATRQTRDLHPIARDRFAEDEDNDPSETATSCGARSKDEDKDMLNSLIPTTARLRPKTARVTLTDEAIEQDGQLAPLVKQLRSHLGSMQSNVAGLKDLRSTMESAEAVVMRFNAIASRA